MAYVRGHPGRLRRVGRRAARRVGVTTRCWPTSRRARALPRAATSSSTPMPTTPKVRSGSPCARRSCAARRSSSRPRSRPVSLSVTTTAETASGDAGVVSLLQTTTRDGKRSSTYHAFLEGDVEQRPNLEVISHAQVTRVILDGAPGQLTARGRRVPNCGRRDVRRARPTRKWCSARARSVHRRSFCSPASDRSTSSKRVGVACQLDSPHVGKHLKDHLQLAPRVPGAGSRVSR